MYKLCKSEQSIRRQREIEDVLLELLLTRRYEDITVSDLCQRIGLPRKSFYRYFSGKDGALFALIDHALLDHRIYITERSDGDSRDPQSYLEGICLYWKNRKKLLDALEKSGLSGVLIQRAILFSREMDSAPSFLRTEEQQLQEYGAMFTTCGIVTMIVQWHRDGYRQSVEQMARLILHLLSRPLFNLETTE